MLRDTLEGLPLDVKTVPFAQVVVPSYREQRNTAMMLPEIPIKTETIFIKSNQVLRRKGKRKLTLTQKEIFYSLSQPAEVYSTRGQSHINQHDGGLR